MTMLPAVVTLHTIKTSFARQELVDKRHDPPLLDIEMLAHLTHEAMAPMSAVQQYRIPFDSSSDLDNAVGYLVRELQGVNPGKDSTRHLRARSDDLDRQEYDMDTPEGRLRRSIQRRPSTN
jgi:hypothetical protein